MKVDNTMLMSFQKCPLFYLTRHEEHWTSRYASGALGHGGAMHEGLKAWYQGMKDGVHIHSRAEMALEAINLAWPDSHPVDDFRTKERALRMMVEYIKEYPAETFQILEVEVPFCFELGRFILWCEACQHESLPFTSTGFPTVICHRCAGELEPIEYGGIFDTLTQFGGGSQSVTYVLEHKTTSQMGPTYFTQWELHNQVTGYCWGASVASGKLVGGANINCLCLTTGGNMKFDRRMIGRNLSQIEEWKNNVARTCNEIAYARRTGQWRMSTEQCVGKYGTCMFHSVHVLSDPDERRRRLEVDYVKQEWDFERRDDTAAV